MKLENKREQFWQWDTGCYLLTEERFDSVDFTVPGSETVYTVLPAAGRVRVPDECLRTSGRLEVYAVSKSSEGQQTRKNFSFRIAPRSKPADYVFTPQEQDTFTTLSTLLSRKLDAPAEGQPGQVLTKTTDGQIWSFTSGSGVGTTFYPSVSAEGILSWENDLGLPNPAPVDLRGGTGQDGFSPRVTVEAVEEGFLLRITNRDGSNEVLLPRAGTGAGRSGATFTPHLSEDGVLSWTNDMGLTNPDSVCIRGRDGAQGIQGPSGPAGQTGPQGPAGTDGRTPVKGVDYFTAEDLSQLRLGLLPLSGGILNGSLDLGGNPLRNLSDPVEEQDGASKAYVDSLRLIFHNVAVAPSVFTADASYTDYPYRAEISLAGVTASHIPEVVFPVLSEVAFAPVCESFHGGVKIYADSVPAGAFTIPTILCFRGI